MVFQRLRVSGGLITIQKHRVSIEGELCSRRLTTVAKKKKMKTTSEVPGKLVQSDRQLTAGTIGGLTHITTVHQILIDDLKTRKICGETILKNLSRDWKTWWKEVGLTKNIPTVSQLRLIRLTWAFCEFSSLRLNIQLKGRYFGTQESPLKGQWPNQSEAIPEALLEQWKHFHRRCVRIRKATAPKGIM